MKKNMNNVDRSIRVLVALVLATLYYFNIIEGTVAYVLMGLSVIFVLTSLVSFCPLYRVFGFSTCKTT